MDVMATPLGDEINRIIAADQGSSNVYIDATIHTKYGDIPALRVLNEDIIRQYHMQYSDEISLTVMIPAGKFAYRVVPSRNELEITIKGANVNAHGVSDDATNPAYIKRYRAILKLNNDPNMEGNSREALDETTMDNGNFEVIEFQLITRAMEQFSTLPCGGIYRRTDVGSLIRSLLLKQNSLLKGADDYRPLGVDMVPVKDALLRDHIVLPHGLLAVDAPGYIHKYCGGVYSTGLSYFYQDDFWYIYPTFDYKRFSEATRQLVIINIPKHKLPGLECTYLTEGSVTNIITTGELSFDDNSDQRKRTSGNGVRFADASVLFDSGVEVSGNKAMLSRGKLNNEFVSSKQKSGINILPTADERITANRLYQSSQLAAKEGVHIQLTWENADVSLITPGMQTKLLYYKNGVVRQVYAVVTGVQSSTQYQGYGTVLGRYNRNVAIYLFAANDVNQEEA